MKAWDEQGMRLDIALAVGMEVAVSRFDNAAMDAERAAALSFNRDLWQVATTLAPHAPVAEDRDELALVGHDVVAGRHSPSRQVELNRSFARRLAGRAATNGALGQLLGTWRTDLRHQKQREFGVWLLERLQDFARRT